MNGAARRGGRMPQTNRPLSLCAPSEGSGAEWGRGRCARRGFAPDAARKVRHRHPELAALTQSQRPSRNHRLRSAQGAQPRATGVPAAEFPIVEESTIEALTTEAWADAHEPEAAWECFLSHTLGAAYGDHELVLSSPTGTAETVWESGGVAVCSSPCTPPTHICGREGLLSHTSPVARGQQAFENIARCATLASGGSSAEAAPEYTHRMPNDQIRDGRADARTTSPVLSDGFPPDDLLTTSPLDPELRRVDRIERPETEAAPPSSGMSMRMMDEEEYLARAVTRRLSSQAYEAAQLRSRLIEREEALIEAVRAGEAAVRRVEDAAQAERSQAQAEIATLRACLSNARREGADEAARVAAHAMDERWRLEARLSAERAEATKERLRVVGAAEEDVRRLERDLRQAQDDLGAAMRAARRRETELQTGVNNHLAAELAAEAEMAESKAAKHATLRAEVRAARAEVAQLRSAAEAEVEVVAQCAAAEFNEMEGQLKAAVRMAEVERRRAAQAKDATLIERDELERSASEAAQAYEAVGDIARRLLADDLARKRASDDLARKLALSRAALAVREVEVGREAALSRDAEGMPAEGWVLELAHADGLVAAAEARAALAESEVSRLKLRLETAESSLRELRGVNRRMATMESENARLLGELNKSEISLQEARKLLRRQDEALGEARETGVVALQGMLAVAVRDRAIATSRAVALERSVSWLKRDGLDARRALASDLMAFAKSITAPTIAVDDLARATVSSYAAHPGAAQTSPSGKQHADLLMGRERRCCCAWASAPILRTDSIPPKEGLKAERAEYGSLTRDCGYAVVRHSADRGLRDLCAIEKPRIASLEANALGEESVRSVDIRGSVLYPEHTMAVAASPEASTNEKGEEAVRRDTIALRDFAPQSSWDGKEHSMKEVGGGTAGRAADTARPVLRTPCAQCAPATPTRSRMYGRIVGATCDAAPLSSSPESLFEASVVLKRIPPSHATSTIERGNGLGSPSRRTLLEALFNSNVQLAELSNARAAAREVQDRHRCRQDVQVAKDCASTTAGGAIEDEVVSVSSCEMSKRASPLYKRPPHSPSPSTCNLLHSCRSR